MSSNTLWKIGLPMYLNTSETKFYYTEFLQQLVFELNQLGFKDDIEIITDFPDNLYEWWLDPTVLFSQSCGYPYINYLKDKVQLVATPCFNMTGCSGPLHSSVFVTHRDHAWQSVLEAKNSHVVINQDDSNSGMNLLRAAILPLLNSNENFFASVQYSNSHMNSLKMIQDKQADLAAIDCVTLAYVKKYAPEKLEKIKILAHSQQTFCLPYISSSQVSSSIKALLFLALKRLLKHQPEICKALFIDSFIQPDPTDYLAISELKNLAFQRQYFELSRR